MIATRVSRRRDTLVESSRRARAKLMSQPSSNHALIVLPELAPPQKIPSRGTGRPVARKASKIHHEQRQGVMMVLAHHVIADLSRLV